TGHWLPNVWLCVAFQVALLGVVLSDPPSCMGQTDTTPPTLTALSVSPATVDTTSGPATVTVRYSASDDLSGVKELGVFFCPKSGALDTNVIQKTLSTWTFPGAGTLNASGSMSLYVPQYAASDVYVLCSVILRDTGGNETYYGLNDYFEAGDPPPFPVQ